MRTGRRRRSDEKGESSWQVAVEVSVEARHGAVPTGRSRRGAGVVVGLRAAGATSTERPPGRLSRVRRHRAALPLGTGRELDRSPLATDDRLRIDQFRLAWDVKPRLCRGVRCCLVARSRGRVGAGRGSVVRRRKTVGRRVRFGRQHLRFTSSTYPVVVPPPLSLTLLPAAAAVGR